MSKAVSIIVPVYNIEPYLPVCLESLISQTYSNIEIILINDGSTDRSGEICKQFAENCYKIKVFSKENSGVSAARNDGLDIASGEYILFVDGDDFIDADCVKKLVHIAEDNNADAVIFEYNVECGDKTYVHRVEGESYNTLVTGEKAIELTISPKNRFAWSKLYRKSIIGDLRFDTEIYRGEDTWFAVNALKSASRVYYTDYAPYHYIQSEGSAVRSAFNARKLSVITVYEYMCDFCRKNYPRLTKTAVNAYAGETIAVIYDMHVSGVSDKEIGRQRKRLLKNVPPCERKLLTKNARLQFELCRYLPKLLYAVKDRTHN
ncbi:MAG: glycosyltransferase [Clostridia bacterium]|nr:glycosyltransferase [Clostridia bacterium]